MENPKIIIMLPIALVPVCSVTIFYNFVTKGEALGEDKISCIKETPIAHRWLHTKYI